MHDLKELVDGYGRFFASRNNEDMRRYQQLAQKGQSPKTMVISCCDSRVDPAAIFDVGPGELFVVRNVANLVPPFEPHGDYHGTSAALEFAVTGLKVENIVVMGHAQCGGVKACLEGNYGSVAEPGFIQRWMSLLDTARENVLKTGADDSDEERQKALELDAIRCSLDNLQTFPFIKEALASGTLRIRGAYFSIFHGSLLGLDSESGEFRSVTV